MHHTIEFKCPDTVFAAVCVLADTFMLWEHRSELGLAAEEQQMLNLSMTCEQEAVGLLII